MIYDIDHLTAYSYAARVTSASLALRLTPRNTPTQRSLSHEIRISPEPDHATSQRDFFGNVVDLVTIDTQHTELKIRSIARVEVMPSPGLAGPDLAWERVADLGIASLPITREDAIAAGGLPPIHRDPFDRMIIAQAARRWSVDCSHARA